MNCGENPLMPLLLGTTFLTETKIQPQKKLAAIFNKANSPPCIAARRGVRAIKENVAKHPILASTGWFSDRTDKEHHPGCVNKDASRHFLNDAVTPPRGDARRGMAFLCISLVFVGSYFSASGIVSRCETY